MEFVRIGSGGGVVEAARARVRCAWAKFKELSPILTVRGASYRIKGRIYTRRKKFRHHFPEQFREHFPP